MGTGGRFALTFQSLSVPTLPPRACTWAGMTVDQCGDPPDLAEAAHQVLMEGAGAHLQGGDVLQAQEDTGDHPALAGGGAQAQDTGGAALPCSGGDLPLLGGETTGDKKIVAFQFLPEFSFVKNMWRQFLICEQTCGDSKIRRSETSQHTHQPSPFTQ